MNFYKTCPADHGYPRFVYATFLDGDWQPHPHRTDSIPATQNGMGILSYLKYFEWGGRHDPAYLNAARCMGDYLVKETNTPALGTQSISVVQPASGARLASGAQPASMAYPAFTRSTGRRGQFPQPEDCGSQSDRPYEIEPDKGGIAGYALVTLFSATGDARYLTQALHNARILARNQADGDASHSPWPFRVDYRNGEARGPIAGNMTYILRLYDALLSLGYGEFSNARHSLWQWIKQFQIPSAAGNGSLFAQFFEDHDTPTNRSAWAPLNLARYLLEKKEWLDPRWRDDAGMLIDFVRRNFTHPEFGITVCHEQDEDPQAWGGINSTYGAVLALYAKATDSPDVALEARQALNFVLYAIDEQGRPRDVFTNPDLGGWQEDAHTDVIHNFVDAMRAFPDWGHST